MSLFNVSLISISQSIKNMTILKSTKYAVFGKDRCTLAITFRLIPVTAIESIRKGSQRAIRLTSLLVDEETEA